MLQRVETLHKQMQTREGSEQIATKTFLLKFGRYFANTGYSPTVIDYGAGIGTISLFAAEIAPQSRRVAVEPNDWCRGEILKNSEHLGLACPEVHKSLDEISNLPKGAVFVIDAPFIGKDVMRIVESEPSAIFVEGHRYPQRELILKHSLLADVRLSYNSFLGVQGSIKGGAIFKSRASISRFLIRVQVMRVVLLRSLGFPRLEWEFNKWVLRRPVK